MKKEKKLCPCDWSVTQQVIIYHWLWTFLEKSCYLKKCSDQFSQYCKVTRGLTSNWLLDTKTWESNFNVVLLANNNNNNNNNFISVSV